MGALSDYRNLHSMIQRELLSLVKSIRFAEYVIDGNDQVAPGDEKASSTFNAEADHYLKVNMLAEINVDFQILQLLDDWKVQRAVKKGDLNIAGLMVYQFLSVFVLSVFFVFFFCFERNVNKKERQQGDSNMFVFFVFKPLFSFFLSVFVYFMSYICILCFF